MDKSSNWEKVLMNLPENYSYSSIEVVDYTSVYQFEVSFCCNLRSQEEFEVWFKLLAEQLKVMWRVRQTFPSGKLYSFKKYYKCQHSYHSKVKNPSKSKKTGCAAVMQVKIKKNETGSKAKRRALKNECSHPCKIVLKNQHNHATNVPEALKYMDVSCEVKEAIVKLFNSGHTPKTAYNYLKNKTMEDNSENNVVSAADSVLPDMKYFYNLFYAEERREFGNLGSVTPQNEDLLKKKLEEWVSLGNGSAGYVSVDSGSVVCVVTQLMLRVHKAVQQSGNLVYIGTGGHCDRYNHSVYLIYTQSIAGSLPLGFIVTQSQSQETFNEALKVYRDILGPEAFFGRGSASGPLNIITDNDISQRSALSNIWPHTNLLLCSVHVMRDVWRWLTVKRKGISHDCRRELFRKFKNLMMCQDEEKLQFLFCQLKDAGPVEFVSYLEETWWELRKAWCMCYRHDLMISDNHTYNYVNYAVRILKDVVLKRIKAYNFIQLVHFIISKFDMYYEQRLIDTSHGSISLCHLAKFLPNCKDVKKESVIPVDESMFMVKGSGSNVFIVDMQVGVCSCKIGITGQLCKHQSAIVMHNLYEGEPVNVINEEGRRTMFFVRTGKYPSNVCDQQQQAAQLQNVDVPSSDYSMDIMNVEYDAIQSIEGVIIEDSNEFTTMSSSGEETHRTFCSILETLKNKTANPTDATVASMKCFIKNFNTLTTTISGINSALNVWGQCSGMCKKRKLAPTTKIKVQPSSINCQKGSFKERYRLIAARPAQSTVETKNKHCYALVGNFP